MTDRDAGARGVPADICVDGLADALLGRFVGSGHLDLEDLDPQQDSGCCAKERVASIVRGVYTLADGMVDERIRRAALNRSEP